MLELTDCIKNHHHTCHTQLVFLYQINEMIFMILLPISSFKYIMFIDLIVVKIEYDEKECYLFHVKTKKCFHVTNKKGVVYDCQ